MSSKGDPGHGHVIHLTGRDLTIDEVVEVARGDAVTGVFPRVELHEETREHMVRMRRALEALIPHEVMYGVNTGCGSSRNRIVPEEDLIRYQRKYIMTHACGTGAPLVREIVRSMMLLRVNSFAVGNSAMTVEMCDLLLEMLNRDITPVVPEFGSVGASGDLIPLAHIGTVMAGIPGAKVFYKGEIRDAQEVFEIEGLKHHVLQPKESMGLTNGSTFMLAMSVLALEDAGHMLTLADLDVAMHMEAIRGEGNAFDERLHQARNQEGQILVAEYVRELLKGSRRTTREAQKVNFPFEQFSCTADGCKGPRVQDAYSVRVSPQAHGAVLDAIIQLRTIVQREINASTDNPLVFQNGSEGTFDVLSGGNFHGDTLAIPLNQLAIALAKLGSIVERRLYRLLDPRFNSGLPENLSGSDESDDTGFMILQYSQASRVMFSQGLANGHAVLSVPTSMGQEDYVSNGANVGWVVRKILGSLRSILAMSLLADCQAIDLGAEHLGEDLSALGEGTQLGYDCIREHVPMMNEDRFLHPDIEIVRQLIVDGTLVSEIGNLQEEDED